MYITLSDKGGTHIWEQPPPWPTTEQHVWLWVCCVNTLTSGDAFLIFTKDWVNHLHGQLLVWMPHFQSLSRIYVNPHHYHTPCEHGAFEKTWEKPFCFWWQRCHLNMALTLNQPFEQTFCKRDPEKLATLCQYNEDFGLLHTHTHTQRAMETATVMMYGRSLPRLMVIISAPHFLPQDKSLGVFNSHVALASRRAVTVIHLVFNINGEQWAGAATQLVCSNNAAESLQITT